MKYVVVFMLVCVALTAAAPQLLPYTSWGAPWGAYGARTLVAGPTVLNGYTGYPGARLIAPGYVGPAFY